MVEAMRLAKNAVKARLRDQGQRIKELELYEINQLAKALLEDHRDEFIAHASLNLAKEIGKGKRASEIAARKAPFHAGSRDH